MMNLELISAVKYVYTASHFARPHNHPCYEIVVYLSGSGVTNIAGHKKRFAAHTLTIIPPYAVHDEYYYQQGGELICIYFNCAKLDSAFVFPENYLINIGGNPDLQRSAVLLYREVLSQQPLAKEKAQLYLESMMIELIRSCMDRKCEKSLDHVYNYICDNFATRLNFKVLAQDSGYSYDYFRRVFRSNYGISPQKLQIQQRFEHAQEMLKKTDNSVTDVAVACGFSDGSQFAHMFHEKFGISPSVYQKIHAGDEPSEAPWTAKPVFPMKNKKE